MSRPGGSRANAPASPGTIRHIPALDGLRGLAVAGVVLFHGGHLVGGYLGVDLFFVLSGYLITSLLLAETARTGSVGLGGFWARRARRLLPALCGVLVGVALYSAVFADAAELGRIRGDALATIGYVANWRAVFAHTDYWALFTAPSPLEHTWSLAIEEQFYVVWPLVFVGLLAWWKRSTPVVVLVVSGVLACASAGLMALLYNPVNVSRVYFGTDTRASGILLGAALAAWLAVRGPVSRKRARAVLEAAAVAALVVLGVAWSQLSGQSPKLYRGGFFVCGLAVIVVLASAAHPEPGPVAKLLSFRPFRALGLISYGVYLWHWPVDVALTTERAHVRGWPLFALQTLVTLAISGVSYRFLEQPIRRGAGSARQWRRLTPVVAVGLVLVLVGATQGASTPPAEASQDQALAGALARANAAPSGAKRLMVVGNSVAYFLGVTLQQASTQPPTVTLNAGQFGCYWPANDAAMPVAADPRAAGTALFAGANCASRWPIAVRQFRPDIVLFLLSGGGSFRRINGRLVHACDSSYDTLYEQRLRQTIADLGSNGARVVLSTAAYSRFPFARDTDSWVDCDNRIRRTVAAEAGIQLIDLYSRVCPGRKCVVTENGVKLRPDGLHYEGPGADIISRWLLEQLHLSTVR